MNRLSLLTITLLATLSSLLLAQSCNNPLLASYGLSALDAPVPGAGLPYCADLQAGTTCCAAETVATFQDRVNAIIDNLNNYAAGRDLYIAQLRNSFLDKFNDMLEDINGDHQGDLQNIRAANATLADELESIINSARQISNDSQAINSQFVGGLDEYQKARSTCWNTALQVQSSAWCQACDPNYASEGVGTGTVTFSEGLCQAISNACSPYFTQAADLNPLFTAKSAYWNLSSVSSFLNDYATTGVLNNFTLAANPYNPLASQQPVTVPEPWVGTGIVTNAAQCQNLWAGDAQLAPLLTIVGSDAAVNDNNQESFIAEEAAAFDVDNEIAEDVAIGGIWGPALTATGLSFDALRLDPGEVFAANA